MVPGGLVKHVGDALAVARLLRVEPRSCPPRTPTPGPGGYANFKTFNTAAPGPRDRHRPDQLLPAARPAARRPAAVHVPRAADHRGGPARGRGPRPGRAPAGARAEIHGLTQNRSIEAHLADHGIMPRARRQGAAEPRPGGRGPHDRPAGERAARGQGRPRAGACRSAAGPPSPTTARSPSRASSTTTRTTTPRRSRCSSSACAAPGACRARQQVLNVYGNSNEGDQSAGLVRDGPAASDYVGRVEAAAMLRAWRARARR